MADMDINNVPLDTESLNKLIAEEAAKLGIDPGAIPAATARDDKGRFVADKKEDKVEDKPEDVKVEEKEEITYVRTAVINGKKMTFEGASEAEVNQQWSAALEAATPVETKPEVKPVTKKLTSDEMFDIGLKLQKGQVEAIDEYLDKSGAIDKYFERKGVKLDDIKQALEERISTKVAKTWDDATEQFKAANPDYTPDNRNMKLIGYKLMELGLGNNPSAESLQKAYTALKQDDMLYTPAKVEETDEAGTEEETEKPKRKATGSSAFGTGSENGTRQKSLKAPKVDLTQAQFDKMSPREMQEYYNGKMVEAGYKQ